MTSAGSNAEKAKQQYKKNNFTFWIQLKFCQYIVPKAKNSHSKYLARGGREEIKSDQNRKIIRKDQERSDG
jgi:hypothetical protein